LVEEDATVNVQGASAARLPLAGFGIVCLGTLVALATDLAVVQLSLVKLAFILGGIALFIPTMVLKDPKAYWLFLLVLSIPFDVSKWLSEGLVAPETLVATYGVPALGTTSIELYLTDVILILMLLPWLGRVCLKRERLFFPKVGYIFLFYLVWALLVSLINAESLYLSMFELSREALYFLFFVYLISNVATRLQFRTVVWAIFLGFVISAGTVIAFFIMKVGTETTAFAFLHDESGTTTDKFGTKDTGSINLTFNDASRGPGLKNRGQESGLKRSQGMFRHPAIAASLCGLILPIALAYSIAARTIFRRVLFLSVYSIGCAALILTFSRAGLIGFIVGTLVFLAVGRWANLISIKVLKVSALALTLCIALGMPFLFVYLKSRPEAFFMRFTLAQTALWGYAEHPILGVGLNNSTAAMIEGKRELKETGTQIASRESADNYYLAVLTEVGPVGFILLFGFFGTIAMIALRTMREASIELKPLLVGMIAGVASLATQSLSDVPMAGHAVSGVLWLYAALVIAGTLFVRSESSARLQAVDGLRSAAIGSVPLRTSSPRTIR
jgi:hypothetical protein